MYSVLPYYLAKTTADLPFQVFFSGLVVTIIYWMVRHSTARFETTCGLT
jgi:hypothetical protein